MNPKLFWLITAILLVLIHRVDAQQPKKHPLVGFLCGSSLSAIKFRTDAFRQGMRDLNYVEGENIRIEWRSAESVDERLPNLANELVQHQVDVIVVCGTPAVEAAKAATKSIPIVMTSVSDPIGSGLVASLARPGGNVTGLTNFQSDLGGKQVGLLKETLPKVAVVTVLWDPANSGNITWLQDMKAAAPALGIAVQALKTHGPTELENALAAIKKERIKAFIVLGNAATNSHRTDIVNFAIKNALSSMYGESVWVESGGLISYGPDRLDQFRRAAVFVDKILKGTKPSDLPVEQPTKFELAINLKTAKQIGLTIHRMCWRERIG